MSELWPAIKHSSARYLVPGLIGIVILHIFGRTRPWEHEWIWAYYQFNFITVMLGPIIAGIGAWDAQRYAKSRWIYDGSDRRFAPVALVWGAVMAWTLATFALGLGLVTFLVRLAGTPGLPGWRAWALLLPAIALLAAEAALGVALGWTIRSPLVSPIVAVVVFMLTIFLYASGPSQLITVGGATASLFGIAPKAGLEWAQVLGFMALAVSCLAMAAWWGGGRGRARRSLALATVVVALIGMGAIIAQGPQLFSAIDEPVECRGEAPAVCGGPGYAPGLAHASEELHPYLEEMQRLGVRVPARFEQGVDPGAISVGPLSASFLKGDPNDAPVLVVNAYLSKACDFETNPEVYDTVGALQFFLATEVGGVDKSDGQLPPVLVSGSDAEKSAWVVSAVDEIERCR